MTNIGTRPTYHDSEPDSDKTIETNIFDFTDEIYGKELTIEFLYKVRDERQFASPEELRIQIEKDKEYILHH